MQYSTPLTDEKSEAPSELPSYMIIQQRSLEAMSSEPLTPVISALLLDLVRDGQSWLQKRHLKGKGAKIMSGRWETQQLEASSWRREEGEQGRWRRVSPPVPTPTPIAKHSDCKRLALPHQPNSQKPAQWVTTRPICTVLPDLCGACPTKKWEIKLERKSRTTSCNAWKDKARILDNSLSVLFLITSSLKNNDTHHLLRT